MDANGVSLNLTYDGLGRVLTRAYPDTGVERFGYAAAGLVGLHESTGPDQLLRL